MAETAVRDGVGEGARRRTISLPKGRSAVVDRAATEECDDGRAVVDGSGEREGFTVPQKTLRAWDDIDTMPPGLRDCVHEFGYDIVRSCLQHGVSNPASIRNLVQNIWLGARQPLQRGGINGRFPVLDTLDWVLSQAGAEISAMRLLRVLLGAGMVIVTLHPSKQAVEASMNTVSSYEFNCTKFRKHHLRISAAISANARHLWPHLFQPQKSSVD